MGVTHHGSVNCLYTVVTHVQRRQVFPHRDENCNSTVRLRPLWFPLRQLARLWDQDGLEAEHNARLNAKDRKLTGKMQQRSSQRDTTIMVSVDWWMLSVARLDLRDDKPWICWELHSLSWGPKQRDKQTWHQVRSKNKILNLNLQWLTSICSKDLKIDRSNGRALSRMLLVPTGPLEPHIWPAQGKKREG